MNWSSSASLRGGAFRVVRLVFKRDLKRIGSRLLGRSCFKVFVVLDIHGIFVRRGVWSEVTSR